MRVIEILSKYGFSENDINGIEFLFLDFVKNSDHIDSEADYIELKNILN